MISVDEALEKVLEAAAARGALPTERVGLREAAGRILRETVTADRDFPPFTRSAMDGYALRAADTAAAPVTLAVIEEIPAGVAPRLGVGPGQASRIMTGAPIPEGADAVQMVERTETLEGARVRVLAAVAPGEHVRRAGEDLKRGSLLLADGALLGAVQIGLMASAGLARVAVSVRPRVAIIPTGDELVGVEEEPGASQIRESNGHTLEVLVRRAGGEPRLHDVAPDDLDELKRRIGGALGECDVLLLSGGVSMGDYDLVGRALAELGCDPAFDRVAIQPGKPLTFGRAGARGEILVFGLPGNPVSTVVDFLVFARPALRRVMESAAWIDATVEARLLDPIRRRPGRRAYLPATLLQEGGEPALRLIPSKGSADMVAMSRADALAVIPETAEELRPGVRVRALPLAGLVVP
ncbi:MAG TPA: gephyrin-like molybdotransferase Glp [Candidatus Polarisedimenticolia bacterium]|jgi:molybdopterin molybdotransferase